MSLALVAYGREVGTRVELVGLDSNAAVIETVRGVAESLGYDEASFEATAIVDYASDAPVDLLVSLHACDTATDEAIAAGVRLGADAIVVAPCCHHELAAQIATRRQGRAAPARAAARPPGRPRHRRAACLGAGDARLSRRRDRVRLRRAHGEERDAACRARAVAVTRRAGRQPSIASCATAGASSRRSSGSLASARTPPRAEPFPARPELRSADERDRDDAGEERPRRDAQGRRDHGRRRRRAGEDRRGGRRLRGHGARARPRRHPSGRRCRPDVRPGHDQGDPGGRHDPGDGEVPHRPFRRGADPAVARDRLHRRVRGADARRPRASRRQVAVHRFRSSAAARTSARRSGASPRARR